jgi:hypothetical protein
MSGKSLGGRGTVKAMYLESKGELFDQMPYFGRIFKVQNTKWDFPVAFATNSIYLMARHGVVCHDTIKKQLFPVIKQKIDCIHNEGIAHLAWGLSRAEIWDQDMWNIIIDEALKRDFNIKVVQHKMWSATSYVDATKDQHVN